MGEWLSRRDLYDLVWSEPMRTLAGRFKISDVALKKKCAAAGVPTPHLGYWAKLAAGKRVVRAALPPRFPGADDLIHVGGGEPWHGFTRAEISGPEPSPPVFDEALEAVRARIAQEMGKAPSANRPVRWHPVIERLRLKDIARQQKYDAAPFKFAWNAPQFESPVAQRRLRLLNSIFLATARLGGKPTYRETDPGGIWITFYGQGVDISLEPADERPTPTYGRRENAQSDRLRFSISKGDSPDVRTVWSDEDGPKLESLLTEIAVEVVLAAEVQYRDKTERSYRHLLKRQAEFRESERERLIVEERAERERIAREEQARVDRLLSDGAAFQQAAEIRRYVDAVIAAAQANGLQDRDELERWREWAHAQADRIDPSIGGRFLNARVD